MIICINNIDGHLNSYSLGDTMIRCKNDIDCYLNSYSIGDTIIKSINNINLIVIKKQSHLAYDTTILCLNNIDSQKLGEQILICSFNILTGYSTGV
jgi:hypothetical protein